MTRKDLTLLDRNRRIVEMIHQGVSYQKVGEHFGISKQRCSQILQESQEEVPDDARREGQLAMLEHVIAENMRRLTEPPPPAMTARGIVFMPLVDDSGSPVFGSKGQPLQDFDKPVPDERFHLEVQDRVMKGIELAAKLGGWARLKARQVDQSQEQADFLAYLQQIADENDQLKKRVEILSRGVIEAEVIPEPPGIV